jgi:hypothetical protein
VIDIYESGGFFWFGISIPSVPVVGILSFVSWVPAVFLKEKHTLILAPHAKARFFLWCRLLL